MQDKLKRLYKYFTAVDKRLNFALFFSVVSIILNDTVFDGLPELFYGGDKLLNAYYDICIGMVVSYVFYFIVVHIKEFKDRENIDSYVAVKSKAIVKHYEKTINAIYNNVKITDGELYPDKSYIEWVFSRIDPNSAAPMASRSPHRFVNWLVFMNTYRIYSNVEINGIFQVMPFLESEHIRLLSVIGDCRHFTTLERISNEVIPNETLAEFADGFHEYSLACKQLDLYNCRFDCCV